MRCILPNGRASAASIRRRRAFGACSSLASAWNAQVTEAMGIGDISVSVWGECDERQGMHFSARGFVHFELIDPATGNPVPVTDGAEGELVYTHLRHEAAPLLRFRS